MAKAVEFKIKNQINASDLWAGIGGHFDSLGQIINEFVDNSVSNFEHHHTQTRDVIITIEEKQISGPITVTIEDSGTGILDLDAAFSMGCRLAAETPLNEHGFGIKHALASANPSNDDWAIYTRTQDVYDKGKMKKISSPYKLDKFTGAIVDDPWPGMLNGTGTFVRFTCARELYNTLAQGMRGGPRTFKTLADYLCEDLGFIYAGIIKSNKASITLNVQPCGENMMTCNVGALEPDWADFVGIKKNSVDIILGGGNVTIDYAFGLINDKPERIAFDNSTARRYYKKSMSASGVEIRINGRVLAYNLFKEIWGREKHNSYNSLLITLDIKSDNKDFLPETRTSKNGFRQGDPRLEEIYDWIRSKMDDPVKDSSQCTDEREKFADIAKARKNVFSSVDPSAVVETEKKVFTTTGNTKDAQRADMYESVNGVITIYEGKIESTTSKDVYQLRMYWDGFVYDEIQPDKAILVANEHPSSVIKLINIVNSMKDAKGNNYNIEAKKWSDL